MTDTAKLEALIERLRKRTERVHDLGGVSYNDDEDCHLAADAIETLTRAVSASRPAVKGLEWKPGRLDTLQHETIRWEASSLLGIYTAYEVYGKCWYETPTHNDFNARPSATIDEAKAAAQSDFEHRIRSALQ